MFKPPMLAKKYEPHKATFPLFAEPKLDGMRLVVIVANKNVVYYTRSGKQMFYDSYHEEVAELARGAQLVFDAELMARDFTETMEQGRRLSNRDESNLVLNVFDVVPFIGWLNEVTEVYTARKLILRSLFHTAKPDKVQHIDWLSRCSCDADVQLLHDICVTRGYEGVMLKKDAPYAWSPNGRRSSDLLKLKRRDRFVCQVIGFQAGQGKHEGRLGALEVVLDDRIFFVGTGFDDSTRQVIWDNTDFYLGMDVYVLGQELTSGGAIRFPVFDGWADEYE
jgi:ATP-dependent DNA ligase